MIKGKRRTAGTITLMTIFGVIVIASYFYWINRTQPLNGPGDNLSDVQEMISKDLKLYYPETPTETVKLYANMIKTMYNNPEDKDVNALALKVRELYDQEFLNKNPLDVYKNNISKELVIWKEKKRRITNYFQVNQDENLDKEINGVKYATRYVKFTIQENTKSTQTWNILLRQDLNKRWKILGWEIVADDK